MKHNNNLSHNLRMLRMYYNKTAIQLSEDLRMHYNRIGDIEHPRLIHIRDSEVVAIAEYFNVSVDALLNKRAEIIFQ